MVYFKDVIVSRRDFLVILDDEEQSVDKGTRLRVHTPIIGNFPKKWPKYTNQLYKAVWTREINVSKTSKAWTLESAHHKPTKEISSLLTLGRRIAEGNAQWRGKTEFPGEFRHFVGYWEWSEDVLSRFERELHNAGIYAPVYASLFTYDRSTEAIKAFCEAWCPSTNTLITPIGELSISLWDLQFLSGLPSTGMFYDEVIPCAAELCGRDQDRKRYIPLSCQNLFHAYHIIGSENGTTPKSSVSIEEWVKFWSRRKPKYQAPPPRKEKKTARLKHTHNPTGEFKTHEAWTSVERGLFIRLGISETYWNETYLAAYIACWLCTFVLPDDDASVIRPSTFKMASMMAAQHRVVLTVPVLTSIYRGLNRIANSAEPSRVREAFPVHFVYAWMAYYFRTHFHLERNSDIPKMICYSGEGGAKSDNARKRVHKSEHVAWGCTIWTEDTDVSFVDAIGAKDSDFCFFMAVRSSYLARRLDDSFVVEPYSPHRFSRQFGYYQTSPGILSHDIRQATLDEGLRHWRTCTLRRSSSKAIFPCSPSSVNKFSSNEYKNWWDQVYKRSVEENIRTAAQPVPKEISKDHGKIEDVGTSDGKRKATPIPLDDSMSTSVERHWKKTKPVKSTAQDKEVEAQSDHAHSHASVDEVQTGVLDGEGSSQASFESIESDHLDETSNLDRIATVKPTPKVGAMSEFNSQNVFDTEVRQCLRNIWGRLRRRIIGAPLQSLSSIEEEIRVGIAHINKIPHDFDLSHLEASIDTLFTEATAYDKARSASLEVGENSAQQVQKVKACLRDSRDKEKEQVIQLDLVKNEIAELDRRRSELVMSLKKHNAELQITQNLIKGFKEEIEKLKVDPLPPDGAVLEALKNSEHLLGVAQKSLEDQDPFA